MYVWMMNDEGGPFRLEMNNDIMSIVFIIIWIIWNVSFVFENSCDFCFLANASKL